MVVSVLSLVLFLTFSILLLNVLLPTFVVVVYSFSFLLLLTRFDCLNFHQKIIFRFEMDNKFDLCF